MNRFYVLTSEQVPENGSVMEEVFDGNGRTTGEAISTDISYTLIEVPAFGSLDGVSISPKLKFAAFLKGDGKQFSDDYQYHVFGVVGDIKKPSG